MFNDKFFFRSLLFSAAAKAEAQVRVTNLHTHNLWRRCFYILSLETHFQGDLRALCLLNNMFSRHHMTDGLPASARSVINVPVTLFSCRTYSVKVQHQVAS